MATFERCVENWCPQANTNQQFTRCESITNDGHTCINPEVRYGTVSGGIPGQLNGHQRWCEQIFESAVGIRSDVAYGSRDCSSPKGRLFWCAGFDETGYKWCDWSDGYWKDQSLGTHSSCDMMVTSLTCDYTGDKLDNVLLYQTYL